MTPTEEEIDWTADVYPQAGDIGTDSWKTYWKQVEATFREVFGGNPPAFEAMAIMRARVESSNGPTQASIYHLDPFQVAADLAGVETVTFEQKDKYGQILQRMSFEPMDAENKRMSYSAALNNEVQAHHLRLDVPDDPDDHSR